MTYQTLSGKKRPRRFLVVAGGILLLLIVVITGSQIQRSSARSQVMATPKPLEAENSAITPTDVSPPPTPIALPEPCPKDASQWQLGDIAPGNNLKAVRPACVYDTLEPVLTWHMMTRRGYTGQEAAQLLGFEAPPVGARIDSIGSLTSTVDPQQIPLTHDALHPEYALWHVDATGQPVEQAYSLRGCFRPFSVVAGQVEDWGTGYDLICTFALDHPAGRAVIQMSELVFTGELPAYRQFYLYGYVAGQWKQIGIFKGLDTPIEDWASLAQDRAEYAQRIGWDPSDLDIDFSGIPLPSNWRAQSDTTDLQAIIARLEAEQ